MTVALNLDDDLAYVDGYEAVTVTLRRAAANVAVSCETAVKHPVSRRQAQASGVQLQGDESAFELPYDEFAAVTDRPKPEDEVTDAAGGRWAILSAEVLPLNAGYSCIVRGIDR